MSQYHVEINNFLENQACELLNEAFQHHQALYTVKRNNLNTNDIDLKVINNNQMICTIDVQYSMDFAKYGDVRIDLMSAGVLTRNQHKKIWQLNNDIKLSSNHLDEFKSLFKIQKYGKYFEKSVHQHLLGVSYCFYNGEFDKTLENFQNIPADFFFFLPVGVVLKEIRENPNIMIKINDKKKNGIKEAHHSAFICLNIDDLCKKYNLPIFDSKENLIENFYSLFQNQLGIFNEN